MYQIKKLNLNVWNPPPQKPTEDQLYILDKSKKLILLLLLDGILSFITHIILKKIFQLYCESTHFILVKINVFSSFLTDSNSAYNGK